jgi:glucose/arabinose dehydrogenase
MRFLAKRSCAATFLVATVVAASARADTLQSGDPANLFRITDFVTGLDQPTSFAWLPDGRLLITEKTGALLLVSKDGKTKQTIGQFPVNTVSEQGLLHVLLHPDFATNRLLFFYYSAADSAGGTDTDRHRVVTVMLGANDQLDMSTEKVLVHGFHGPQNHDGGSLAIGPDGKLYIGDGDSGCNSNQAPEPPYTPTNFFATCLTNPNGKILRVNLDGTIPADNPLVGKSVTACGDACATDVTTLPLAPAREDIWAWGFRNPWRFWFDPKTKNLWVGDVGEVTYEEIDVIPPSGAGKHYGWPWREAAFGHPPSTCQQITPNAGDCIDPQYFCVHGTSSDPNVDGSCQSITGGLIVDSCAFPSPFRGRYFFADNAAHWLATLDPTADRNGIVAGSRKMFAKSAGEPVHLDVGPDGALYYAVIAGSGSSTIERVFPKSPVPCAAPDGGSGAGGPTSAGGATGTGSTSAGSGGGAAGPSAGGAPNAATGSGGGTKGASDGGLKAGSRETSSCGCRTAASGRSAWSSWVVALVLASAARRRRAARTRRP